MVPALEEVRQRAYSTWWGMLSDAIDPRVWTHCRLLRYPDGREELLCDGVVRGAFWFDKSGRSFKLWAK